MVISAVKISLFDEEAHADAVRVLVVVYHRLRVAVEILHVAVKAVKERKDVA